MNKVFIYLCTVIALFVSVSGMASIRRVSDILVHLLFLPVTLYLCTTSLRSIFHPKRTQTPFLTSHTTILSGLLILLVIVIIAKIISITLLGNV